MPTFLRLLLATLALVLLPLSSAAQPAGERIVVGESTLDGAKISQTIEAFGSSLNIPSMAVAIFDDSGVAYTYAYGEATPQRPFYIGSVSKPVTATLLMRLVEAGAIELEAPASQYVDIELPDDIRVIDLLRHRSGIPQSAGYPGWSSQSVSLKEWVERVDLRPAPRSFEYSNLNYALLGAVIEGATGTGYAEALQTQLTDPLGMEQTAAPGSPRAVDGLVGGHQYYYGFPAAHPEDGYLSYEIPAGYVTASATDLGRLGAMYLNGGALEGSRVLTAGSVERLLTPPETGVPYAAGWSIDAAGGLRLARHEGLNRSYASAIALLPDQGVGAVVLTNVNHFAARAPETLARNLALMAAGQPSEELVNVEFVVRLALGALTALFLVLFFANLFRWLGRGLPVGFVRGSDWLRVGFSLVVSVALLVGVPLYFHTTLRGIFYAQPDLTGTLVVLGVCGFLNEVLGRFLAGSEGDSM